MINYDQKMINQGKSSSVAYNKNTITRNKYILKYVFYVSTKIIRNIVLCYINMCILFFK